jgi:hypothetical protein
MAEPFAASGTVLSTATYTTTPVGTTGAGSYGVLTWNIVGLVESVGEFGDEANAISFAALGDGRVRKSKGARDAGTMAITVAYDSTDVGQTALETAEGTNVNVAFKVQLPNKITGPGAGEILYFLGLVMSKRNNVGNNDNIVRRTFNVAVNSPLTRLAAS